MRGSVGKQVQLPLGKAAEIAVRSLRVRMGRSMLTIITIVMAIAFLAYVWSMRSFEPGARAAALAAQGVVDGAPPPSLSRTLWLMTLSLLVCTVGIANAMLMSVMERFREIGTMKCLGALDGFIVRLFLLESLFQGAVGTTIGIVVGLLLSLLGASISYGGDAWRNLPGGELGVAALICLGVGIGLTVAGAVYPAWTAARMQPIAAMRVET